MPSVRINSELENGQYFLTFTVKNFYYLFDRYDRWDILFRCLEFCRSNKNLKINSFVFMLNHIHLIVESEDVIDFVRSFKSFTAKQLIKNIRLTEPQLLHLFKEVGNTISFWGKTNMPKLITSDHYYIQKKEYIENNPVKKNYVMLPEHWYWSSANPKCELVVD